MTRNAANPTFSRRANRPLALVFALAALLLAVVAFGLLLRVDGQPLRVEFSEGGATVAVTASQTSVALPTDCLTLDWQARGVTDVTHAGQPAPANGRADVCLDRAAPGLEFTLPDGARQSLNAPVGVNATRPLTLLFLALPVLVLALAGRVLAGRSSRGAGLVQAALTLNGALVAVLTPLIVSLTRTQAAGGQTLAYAGFAVWGAVSLALFALAFARPTLLAPESPLWARLRARPIWRIVVALVIVLFWLGVLRLTALLHLLVSPFALLPVYAGAAALGIGALWLVERDRRSWAFYLALSIAAACVIRDTVLSSTFYFLYETDSWGYLRYARYMFDPTTGNMPISRTLNYPLVINLLLFPFSSGQPISADWFWRVVHFQMLAAAFATGLLVYVLGKRDRTLALVAGVFLALDVVWGAYQRWVFTESLTMSFLVISLAVLVSHYTRAKRLRWYELLLAGILFGWTVTLRASNLYFAVAIVVFYLLFTRSPRKTVLVGAGIGLFLLAASLFNLWRFDAFRLSGQQGFFLGWPALGYHLYAPDNGPVSAQFAQEVGACRPELDLTTMEADWVNYFIWQQIIPCYNGDLEVVTERFSGIFGEAFRRRPLDYLTSVLRENAMLLAYPMRPTTPFVLQTTIEMFQNPLRQPACSDAIDSWCRYRPYPRDPYAPLLAGFASGTNFLVQPYLLVAPPGPLPPGRTEELYRYMSPPLTQPPSLVVATLAWLVMLGFTVYRTRGVRRFVVLVSAALIHYVILVVTAAMVYDILNSRLLTALTPFFALVSAAFFIEGARLLRAVLRRRAAIKNLAG